MKKWLLLIIVLLGVSVIYWQTSQPKQHKLVLNNELHLPTLIAAPTIKPAASNPALNSNNSHSTADVSHSEQSESGIESDSDEPANTLVPPTKSPTKSSENRAEVQSTVLSLRDELTLQSASLQNNSYGEWQDTRAIRVLFDNEQDFQNFGQLYASHSVFKTGFLAQTTKRIRANIEKVYGDALQDLTVLCNTRRCEAGAKLSLGFDADQYDFCSQHEVEFKSCRIVYTGAAEFYVDDSQFLREQSCKRMFAKSPYGQSLDPKELTCPIYMVFTLGNEQFQQALLALKNCPAQNCTDALNEEIKRNMTVDQEITDFQLLAVFATSNNEAPVALPINNVVPLKDSMLKGELQTLLYQRLAQYNALYATNAELMSMQCQDDRCEVKINNAQQPVFFAGEFSHFAAQIDLADICVQLKSGADVVEAMRQDLNHAIYSDLKHEFWTTGYYGCGLSAEYAALLARQ